jgi:hypothetical protein
VGGDALIERDSERAELEALLDEGITGRGARE